MKKIQILPVISEIGVLFDNLYYDYSTRLLVYKMPKAKIAYVQNDEPDFIKKFKQKVGYKEGPTVDTKVLVSVVSW